MPIKSGAIPAGNRSQYMSFITKYTRATAKLTRPQKAPKKVASRSPAFV